MWKRSLIERRAWAMNSAAVGLLCRFIGLNSHELCRAAMSTQRYVTIVAARSVYTVFHCLAADNWIP